jgi:hypothetical protein
MTIRRSVAALLALAAVLLGVAGCSSRVDDSEGGVILSVSDFDGLPIRVNVNEAGFPLLVTIDEITIENIPKDPSGTTSDLMNVEMQAYEVRYARPDSGTRLPDPIVEPIFGVAPVGGNVVYNNLAILKTQQFLLPPLSDLLVSGGGIDTETGSPVITLEFTIRFFGRTLTGDDVATAPIRFDVELIS